LAGDNDDDDGGDRGGGKSAAALLDKDGRVAAAAESDDGDASSRKGWLGAVLRAGRRSGGGVAAAAGVGAAAGGAGGALRVGQSAGLGNGPVDADTRAAAAAAKLSRARPRPPLKLTLETVNVSRVSRDARQHRFRTLLADVTGVGVHAFVDVDRFGTTTAVTLVADAAAAFRTAVGRGRAATVLRWLPAADPWSPALLGGARRGALGGGALAADVAAADCRRRLTAKLEQLPRRGAMPPHIRASLHAHITGMLAPHDEGAAATAAALAGVAARSPGAAADAVARPS